MPVLYVHIIYQREWSLQLETVKLLAGKDYIDIVLLTKLIFRMQARFSGGFLMLNMFSFHYRC
jgi:hypothetical protein